MGLEATWQITCDNDNCEKRVQRTLVLSKETIDGITHCDEPGYHAKTYHTDIWGPGVPEGWIQRTSLEQGYPYFFCGKECYRAWLLEKKGPEAVKRFDESVWTA